MKKLSVLITLLFSGFSLWAQDFEAGEKLFNSNCKACHSIGEGKRVGPDLLGVSERRKEDWLFKFIRKPGDMIKSDPEAQKLFDEYNQILMPDHAFLSDEEIKSMLAFIASRGTPAAAVQEKPVPETKAKVKPAEQQEKPATSPASFINYLIYTMVAVILLLTVVTFYFILQIRNLV